MAIDRLDSDGHYETGNVVPCCDLCNSIKSAFFTFEDMLILGAAVRTVRENHGGSFDRKRFIHGKPRLPDD